MEEFECHHVLATVNQILSRSPEIAERVEEGKVGIVGLRYRLSDGLTETVITRNAD